MKARDMQEEDYDRVLFEEIFQDGVGYHSRVRASSATERKSSDDRQDQIDVCKVCVFNLQGNER